MSTRYPLGWSALLEASDADSGAVLELLRTRGGGLADPEVARRRPLYGPNEVAHEQPLAWPRLLAHNLRNPFVLVLTVLGVASYLSHDVKGTTVVGAMVALSVLMRFLQEYRSSRAAEALRAQVSTTATVTRDGERREVSFRDLVPGDIVHLSAGDMVPGDVRLLSSKDLFVSQSALTGEAMPVEKYDTLANIVEKTVGAPDRAHGSVLERRNLAFMGTNVVSGSATGAVVATGSRTYFGSLARGVVGHRSLTSFDKGVNRVTWVLIRFMLVMVPVILLINGGLKGDWKEAFLFALSVAVGLTPEMLPMVVTANLARGAVAMARHKVIVKRLNAIQNFGAMDILCTDKTGTLTRDEIVLERHLDIHGRRNVRVLECAYLNSYYQTGLKNLLDRAILHHAELRHELNVPTAYTKIDEIPFDFIRRRMSVILEHKPDEHLLICKGAVEEVVAVCAAAEDSGSPVPLTRELREALTTLVQSLNETGLRVVAVAHKILESSDRAYAVDDESDLVLVGFIAFLDPPRDTAGCAIAALDRHGVAVKILTGDNDIVARRVCRDVGLPVSQVLIGSDLAELSEKQLAVAVERVTLFAKLTPLQKARIITALRRRGHTVGYLGDGINDAAALRDADVGISVDSATDIARESADIILLDKDLRVLEQGVLKGREVYGNIIKYIKMTASSNFGNVLSVLVASAFLPFLPMLPLQLLVQNLLYDLSQLALPWDRMDHEFVAAPRPWQPGDIARFMLCLGPVSSVFDIATFLVMWHIFQAKTVQTQSLFQTGWFVVGLLTQTLIIHMLRTQRVPFVQSLASRPVLLTTAVIMAVGLAIPFSSLGVTLGMVRLPFRYFLWLGGILLCYCALTQVVKRLYIKRVGSWL